MTMWWALVLWASGAWEDTHAMHTCARIAHSLDVQWHETPEHGKHRLCVVSSVDVDPSEWPDGVIQWEGFTGLVMVRRQ